MSITFTIPEGYTLPEGAESGSFDALATLRVDGENLVLTAIDGMPVGGGGEEEEEEEEYSEEEYAEATDPDTGDFERAVTMGLR